MFHEEVSHVKQILINNNYSNTLIDKVTQKFVNKKVNSNSKEESTLEKLNLYIHNQMHKNYNIDEKVIRDIIMNNTRCNNQSQKLNIIFYYKNLKTSNLVMKNNLTPQRSHLFETNVIYEFNCPFPNCQSEKYIGMTQNTLSRRLTLHAQSGSICKHFQDRHKAKPNREQLTDNTKIIEKATNRHHLKIKEALLILKRNPSINKQYDNFENILKLHTHKKPNLTYVNKTIDFSNHITYDTTPSAPNISQILDNSQLHVNIQSNNNIRKKLSNEPLTQNITEKTDYNPTAPSLSQIESNIEIPIILSNNSNSNTNNYQLIKPPTSPLEDHSHTISQRIRELRRKSNKTHLK